MRTVRIIAAGFVIVTALVSCATELPFNQNTEGIQSEQDFSIWAYHSGDDSKSVLGEGGSVLWSPNDSISFFYGNQYQNGELTRFVSDNTSPASSARFFGKRPVSLGSDGSDGYYYALYPYDGNSYFSYGSLYYTFPNIQKARKGSFGAKAFPSVARSKDLQMFFYNVCGGIKLTVTKPGIQKISFKANAGEKISGSGYIYFDDEGRPFCHIWDDGTSTVDLLAPEGGFEVGAPYYVILPPNTYTQGFTITFLTETEKAVRVIDKSVTIERSIFSRLSDADKSLVYTKLPTALEMLSGPEGMKYWLWDIISERDGVSCGYGANNGNGYKADDNVIPDKWWGSSPEALADTESSFAYMTIDSDGNCISYTEGGQEIRKGRISVSGFSSARRADDWSLGKFCTDAPAVLWPYDFRQEPIKEFDILRLNENQLILAHNDEGTTTGSGGIYHWWRFRAMDKNTFEGGKPTGITLDKTSLVTYQGLDFELRASVEPEDKAFWGVAWSTNKDNLVYHNGNGKYYAYSNEQEGDISLTITAKTAGGLSASCDVTIKTRIPVTDFKVEHDHFDMLEGETVEIKATVMPENATLREVDYESQDTNVATVDENGVITAVAPGWTNIIARTDGGNWSRWISIYVRDKRVGGISLNKWSLELFPGESETLTASVYPEYAENKNVIWSSYNTDIATVNDEGYVKAVAPGWTQVMVETEESGYVAYCSVYVKERPVSGLTLDRSSAELFVGERLLLTATITPADATNQAVTWRSDKASVATVDRNGLVRAVGSGTATITATSRDGAFSASCSLTIRSNGVEPGIGDWGEGEHHEGETY